MSKKYVTSFAALLPDAAPAEAPPPAHHGRDRLVRDMKLHVGSVSDLAKEVAAEESLLPFRGPVRRS